MAFIATTLCAFACAATPALAATPEAPEAVKANPVAATTATLNGVLNPKAPGEAGRSYEFFYRESATECRGENEKATSSSPAGAQEKAPASTKLTGLTPHTQYTFCLLAHNEGGEESPLSLPLTFTTLPAAPVIKSVYVANDNGSSLELKAEINTGGAATTAHFEWGTSTEYANSTPQSASIGEDNSVHTAAAPITGLQINTTYHFRVVAHNSAGTVTGEDHTSRYEIHRGTPGECPSNEARRIEQGTTVLPDCRAYELVTPSGKDSGEPRAVYGGFSEPGLEGIEGAHAAIEGERMAWDSEYVFPGSIAPGLDYLSTRGAAGWSSENAIPPQSVSNGLLCPNLIGIVAWSSDLSKGVLADGFGQAREVSGYEGEGLECGHDEPRLAPVTTSETAGEQEGFQNLFVRNNATAGYQLVDVTPPGVRPPAPGPNSFETQFYSASFLAGTPDLSLVVFEEELGLTLGAPSGDDLYEWTGGKVSLVSVLPDGTNALGILAGSTRNSQATSEYHPPAHPIPTNIANYRQAVSADGSRVFFEAEGNLYLREHGEREQSALGRNHECLDTEKACTVQVDASQASGPSGGGKFMVASANGEQVFFLDESQLTAGARAEAGKPDLYEYDLEKPLGERLTDLTANTAEPADVLGVSGAGEESGGGGGGAYVYFVADGVLAANASAGQYASAGKPNLYVYHGDALSFIATLNPESDSCDWASNEGCAGEGHSPGDQARVSPNGRYIGFPSPNSLTGYNNHDAHSGSPDTEMYLYDAASGELACASCDPSGAPPTAPAIIRYPAQPDTFAEQRNMYPQRNVSNDGQVFFETADELLPQDTNGQRNVYEYEHGALYSISSGKSGADSYFLDASANGSDVFFATAEKLLPSDQDAAYDIYDARVGGGFAEPAAPTPPCASNEACAGSTPAASLSSAPSSATFVGAGNPAAGPGPNPPVKTKSKPAKCKRHYVKRKSKCVRIKAKAKAKKTAKGRK